MFDFAWNHNKNNPDMAQYYIKTEEGNLLSNLQFPIWPNNLQINFKRILPF